MKTRFRTTQRDYTPTVVGWNARGRFVPSCCVWLRTFELDPIGWFVVIRFLVVTRIQNVCTQHTHKQNRRFGVSKSQPDRDRRVCVWCGEE